MPGDTSQQYSHEDNNHSPHLESASQTESTGRPAKKNPTEEQMQERTTRAVFMNEWREECPISISTCYTTPIQISPSSKTKVRRVYSYPKRRIILNLFTPTSAHSFPPPYL